VSEAEPSMAEFTHLVRRAGLDLTAAEIEALRAEISPSRRALREMSQRIRARLTAESEPAHRFRRGTIDDER
jgi:hypothetical protein